MMPREPWADLALRRGHWEGVRVTLPWGGAVQTTRSQTWCGRRAGQGLSLHSAPDVIPHPQTPLPVPSSASGGGADLEGESKCIWPQPYLPRWVAIRQDCVTPSSSAQDRSVHPVPTPTLSLPLGPEMLCGQPGPRGAAPARQRVACSLRTRTNLVAELELGNL